MKTSLSTSLTINLSRSASPEGSKREVNLTVNQWVMKKLKKPLKTKYEDEYKFVSKLKKPAPKITTLQKKLKLQHKNKEGTKIINLPKLPFGHHETYNSEAGFSKTHFVMSDDDLTPRRRKELTELSHKFRLMERRKKKRYMNLSQAIFASDNDKVVMPTRSGQLTVAKELEVMRAYEAQRNAFLGLNKLVQTNREVEQSQAFNLELKKRIKSLNMSVDLDQSTTRLHETTRRVSTSRPIAVSLEKKFSELLQGANECKKEVKTLRRAVK
mmetsp:Transcript_14341/g.26977  ORF Transcript_14341/g.26977 Transcript_14341/m.26977 type:complete len:270 (+) Transcript_14341:1-810(+)|eukprot:CAMPEP_0204909198 /NCGR_PEP_ID=MMETSP1397-20131031/7971_1 /ASSEMBLY_ACC=CAM_ASM_000891 /TAXON_ID=49980 /ORGANISM="Climacostomum Climacostomum virens, Strain Stock W-24" /LENGTH=269 /DNA_ID=CAMNT_0052078955 /DNA_START=1 /DNA_END=810 /DNA_ORIENTATION=+